MQMDRIAAFLGAWAEITELGIFEGAGAAVQENRVRAVIGIARLDEVGSNDDVLRQQADFAVCVVV